MLPARVNNVLEASRKSKEGWIA